MTETPWDPTLPLRVTAALRHAFDCRVRALQLRHASRCTLEADYDRLRRAVNASGDSCTDGCDSYGHSDACQTYDPAAWLVAMQDQIDSLRARLGAE